MSNTSKKEYLIKILERYRKASKKDKTSLPDELYLVCGYNRKYAIRKLNNNHTANGNNLNKRGVKKQYSHPDIFNIIRFVWRKTNLPCSKRLVEILSLWVPFYPHEISEETRRKVLNISAATIRQAYAGRPRQVLQNRTGNHQTRLFVKKAYPYQDRSNGMKPSLVIWK